MRKSNKRNLIVVILIFCILTNSLQSSANMIGSAVLEEVTASVPGEVTLSTPKEMTPSIPEEVTSSVPKEVTSSVPKEVTVSVPTNNGIEKSSRNDFSYESASKKQTIYNIVLDSLDDIKKDALKDYSKYYSKEAKVEKKSKYVCWTYNYSQTKLNKYYKKEYGVNISGTCSMVASTSVAEYYTRKNYAKTLGRFKTNQLFSSLVLMGFGTGAYTGNSTKYALLYNVINKFYNTYNKTNYGKYITENVKKEVNAYNRRNRPVVGHFRAPNGEGHAMVIAGYYEVTITYQKKKNGTKGKKVIGYYAVNDGWNECTSGNRVLSYVRSDYLKNGITVFK